MFSHGLPLVSDLFLPTFSLSPTFQIASADRLKKSKVPGRFGKSLSGGNVEVHHLKKNREKKKRYKTISCKTMTKVKTKEK